MQLHVLASILKTLAKARLTVVAVIVVVVVVVGLPLYIYRHFAAEISIKWFGFMLTKYIVFLWYFVCLSGIFYAYFMPCLTRAPKRIVALNGFSSTTRALPRQHKNTFNILENLSDIFVSFVYSLSTKRATTSRMRLTK